MRLCAEARILVHETCEHVNVYESTASGVFREHSPVMGG